MPRKSKYLRKQKKNLLTNNAEFCIFWKQERRRLRERFPSLALTVNDAEACRANLSNYETLANAREVCEGKCAMGRPCPTGLCRQRSKRFVDDLFFLFTPASLSHDWVFFFFFFQLVALRMEFMGYI